MSVRRLSPNQPESFAFTAENLAWAEKLVGRYPEGKQASAVIPLLWRAQEQNGGWVSEPMIRVVAEMLDMARIRVLEIATFYTMFQLAPVGRKAHIQVCGTTPCMLRGAEDLVAVCKRRIATEAHRVSDDGDFSWEEVECLGACVNAPMVQIWSDTYEDLTPEALEEIIEAFATRNPPRPGPRIARQFSAPEGGPTTLTDPALYGGYGADPVIEQVTEVEAMSGASEDAEMTLLEREETEMAVKLGALPADASPEQRADAVGTRPEGLDAPSDGGADDLKRIKGIGRVNEEKLNALGVYHFHQIAAWGRPEIRWVSTYLSFPGRIDREDWLAQARVLAMGGETEFSGRVDAGEVATSRDGESEDHEETSQ